MQVTAARRVYEVPEVWMMILKSVEKNTLVSMSRLAKGAVASVAEILYEQVDISFLYKMSRATKRRAAYCDAVRVLDISYVPHIGTERRVHRQAQGTRPNTRPTSSFNPNDPKLKSYIRKYPNIRIITNSYPELAHDTAYILHVVDGIMASVEIETYVEIDVYSFDFDVDGLGTPQLPSTPTYPGLTVQHTLRIKLVDGSGPLRTKLVWDYPQLRAHTKKWVAWLYQNEKLDRRVSSIDHHSPGVLFGLRLSLEEGLAFLEMRRSLDCAAITKFSLEGISEKDGIRVILESLGRSLRATGIPSKVLALFDDVQQVVDLLDEYCPDLHELSLSLMADPDRPLRELTPLKGLPNLRKLTICGWPREPLASMARYVAGLGSRTCVYLDPGKCYRGTPGMSFDAGAKRAKSIK